MCARVVIDGINSRNEEETTNLTLINRPVEEPLVVVVVVVVELYVNAA